MMKMILITFKKIEIKQYYLKYNLTFIKVFDNIIIKELN